MVLVEVVWNILKLIGKETSTAPFTICSYFFLTKPLENSLKAQKVNTIRQEVQSWKVMSKILSGACVGTGSYLCSS